MANAVSLGEAALTRDRRRLCLKLLSWFIAFSVPVTYSNKCISIVTRGGSFNEGQNEALFKVTQLVYRVLCPCNIKEVSV